MGFFYSVAATDSYADPVFVVILGAPADPMVEDGPFPYGSACDALADLFGRHGEPWRAYVAGRKLTPGEIRDLGERLTLESAALDLPDPVVAVFFRDLLVTHPGPRCGLAARGESGAEFCAQGQCGIGDCPGGACSDSAAVELRLIEL